MKGMLTYASFTDKGGREINEDSIGVFENGENRCFVLCDGLGGHGMGDVASSLVVDVFREQIENLSELDGLDGFLGRTILMAQGALLEKQRVLKQQKKMKTTAVALAIDKACVHIGHVGDSRAYIFKKNKINDRTKDHSIPQMLVMAGEIKEKQIRNHPERNIVLRVMGVEWEKSMYELMSPLRLKKNQSFLLCSDGFWELIEEEEMCRLLKNAKTVDEWLEGMISAVKKNGEGRNMDNYSAIAVWYR